MGVRVQAAARRRLGRRPRQPTAHPPGSDQKIVELRRRLKRGEGLFHPLDAPDWGGTLGSEVYEVVQGGRAGEARLGKYTRPQDPRPGRAGDGTPAEIA